MSIYVYELLDPVTHQAVFAGSSHRPSEIYQEHLDGECAETAALVNEMLSMGRLPVMKIVSEHNTWKEAQRFEHQNELLRSGREAAMPFYAAASLQDGFCSFM